MLVYQLVKHERRVAQVVGEEVGPASALGGSHDHRRLGRSGSGLDDGVVEGEADLLAGSGSGHRGSRLRLGP